MKQKFQVGDYVWVRVLRTPSEFWSKTVLDEWVKEHRESKSQDEIARVLKNRAAGMVNISIDGTCHTRDQSQLRAATDEEVVRWFLER